MKDLGLYLKSERINSGVSLSEAASDLDFSISLLENIESGNVRAFKDIYQLREDIKRYSKYLGVDLERVNNEFNDFLFEKTSKISLEDIKNAQVALKKEKKVISPYTKKLKPKIKSWVILVGILIIFIIFLIIFLIFNNLNDSINRVDELIIINERILFYE